MRSSSEEWMCWTSRSGRIPNIRSDAEAVPLRRAMNGDMILANSMSGSATQPLSRSGITRATVFGASSPNTTCRKVITVNPTAIPAAVCVAPG